MEELFISGVVSEVSNVDDEQDKIEEILIEDDSPVNLRELGENKLEIASDKDENRNKKS